MTQPPFRRWLSGALLAACLTPAYAAKVEFFDDVPVGPQPLTDEEHRYLAFGEVMYDYYRNADFQAINKLLVNKQNALFNQETDYAQLLLGDLYVSYGLPDKAEVIFNELLKKDIVTRTRAQTWLHKAELHYHEGRLDKAAMILDSDKMEGLKPEDDAKRRLMLANIMMKQEDFTGALDYLYSVPVDTDEGRYATYNMGVALIRAGHTKQGLKVLHSLVDAGGNSEQALALRDRAALAAGLTELRDKQNDAARASLSQVRSQGPFSEDALLALGLANYRAGQVRKALPLWLEAVRRSKNHPSVQEALMLAPRAYEELGAMPQALAGYQYAAQAYRQALKDLQRTIDHINKGGWAEAMLPKNPNENGLLPASIDGLAQGDNKELAYLYKLFSSNEFAQRFKHYRQVHQIKDMLDHWQQSLPALQESYQIQQQQLRQALPKVRAAMSGMIGRQEQLTRDSNALVVPDRLDMSHPEDLGNAGQAIMWDRIQSLSQQFDHLPGNSQRNKARLQRLRGLLLWDIANKAQQQRQQQEKDHSDLNQDSNILARRVAAVRLQISDASLRTHDDLGQRLQQQETRIQTLQKQTSNTLQDLEKSMRDDALNVLQQTQHRLADQLAEAHLAIARLQDSSVSERNKQGDGS
ncbi:MAG: tetratricopeptide repeat protein [Alcanivorax sp.]|nr:tetratricopeptide repeat protein [Alcanivorax sp.]